MTTAAAAAATSDAAAEYEKVCWQHPSNLNNANCSYSFNLSSLRHSCSQGVKLHQQHKLADAEAAYRTALRLNPAHAACLHQLGALLIQQHGTKQYKEALQLVQAAIQLAPSNARYRHSLGVVHETAQQWQLAADAFQRAVEKQPDDVKVCFMHMYAVEGKAR